MTTQSESGNCFSNISTHILTRRMTFYHPKDLIYGDISTHILTRRMTKLINVFSFVDIISTHILTRRMTFFLHRNVVFFHISTHILTRRMTAILNKNNPFKITYYINNKHFISIVDIFFHFHIYFQA